VGKPIDTDATMAATAALSICESFIAMSDLNVIGERETLAVLEDAAATHRYAIPRSTSPDEHRAAAVLIEQIAECRKSARKR